jgi:hypothetical protein
LNDAAASSKCLAHSPSSAGIAASSLQRHVPSLQNLIGKRFD